MTEQAKSDTATETLPPDVAEKHKLCLMLYIIFAASLLLQFINLWTIVLGSAAVLAGIIIAYTERKKAFGTVYGNHLQWIIRTFWIGGAVYLPILTIVGTIVMFFYIDYDPMREALATGEGTMRQAVDALMAKNRWVITITMAACTAPFSLWWLYRCWYGYRRLKAGKPVPNAESWL